MRLSIIVPVYNMAHDGILEFCLDSLLNQTISDYEIIAVDDKSTDDSLKVLREYEKNHPEKIRVIASENNRKQGGAKNLGIRAAKGDWFGFVYSSDWVSPDYYEKLLNKADETGADIVGCNSDCGSDCNSYTHTNHKAGCVIAFLVVLVILTHKSTSLNPDLLI